MGGCGLEGAEVGMEMGRGATVDTEDMVMERQWFERRLEYPMQEAMLEGMLVAATLMDIQEAIGGRLQ